MSLINQLFYSALQFAQIATTPYRMQFYLKGAVALLWD